MKQWVLCQLDVFDRLVFRRCWVYRQHLCMDYETGAITWRDVSMFGGRLK